MNRFDRYRLALFALALFFLLPLAPAHAHKLNIFAWSTKDAIQGEAIFSGGKKAKHTNITVKNLKNQSVLLETLSDTQGEFHFVVPEQALQEQVDLLVVGNAGEGHQGEWLLPAAEYRTSKAEKTPLLTPQEENVHVDEELIRGIVAEEINRELSPIRQALAESQEHKPTLRDVLGGIGWIIGLAGLFTWFHNNKKNGKK